MREGHPKPDANSAALVALSNLRPLIANLLRRNFPTLAANALDDIWQEVLIAAWHDAERLGDLEVSEVRRWVCAVARHRALDIRRKQSSQGAAEREYASTNRRQDDESLPVALALDANAFPEWLANELSGLPSQQRRFVELRYWKGLSLAEIAAVLGISAANAAAISSRLLRTFRHSAPSTETHGTPPEPLTPSS